MARVTRQSKRTAAVVHPKLLTDQHKQFLPNLCLDSAPHPLWSHGKAYYTRFDHTLEVDDRLVRKKWEEELKVPASNDEEALKANGLTELEWGDAIFLRVSDNPAHDILVAAVTPEKLIDPHIASLIDETFDFTLGPKSECGPNKPVLTEVEDDNGKRKVLKGGTAFERATGHNSSNRQGFRCYANAITVETGPNIIAPAANLSGESDEALDVRRQINLKMSEAHSTILADVLPSHQLDLLEKRREILNGPTYGVKKNLLSGLQVNVGSATYGVVTTLADQLGTAGDGHTDGHDDCGSMTCMTIAVNLPEGPGVHPGIFHLLGLGAFVKMIHRTSLIFNSHNQHGGTAPFIPSTYTPHGSYMRVGYISYPTQATGDRSGLTPLYIVPGGSITKDAVATPAHPLFPDPNLRIPSDSRCTFARNGKVCMADDTWDLFMRRELYINTCYLAMQSQIPLTAVPPFETFALDSNGKSMGTWELGPTGNQIKRMEALQNFGIMRLRIAAVTYSLLNTQVNKCFIPGIPRVLSEDVLEMARDGRLWVDRYTDGITNVEALEHLARISESPNLKLPEAGSSRTRSTNRTPPTPKDPAGSKEPTTPKKPTKRKRQGGKKGVKADFKGDTVVAAAKKSRGARKPKKKVGDVENRDEGEIAETDLMNVDDDLSEEDSNDRWYLVDDDAPTDGIPHAVLLLNPFTLSIAHRTAIKEFTAIKESDFAKGFARNTKITLDTKFTASLIRQYSESPSDLTANPLPLTNAWAHIKEAASCANNIMFTLRRARQAIMLGVHMMSAYLKTLQDRIVSYFIPGSPPGPRWLDDLLEHVEIQLITNKACVYDRRSYIKESSSMQMRVTSKGTDLIENPELRHLKAKEVAEDLICFWHGFPRWNNRNAQKNTFHNWPIQGQFVDYLLRYSGTPDILLLDCMWECFESVRPLVLNISPQLEVTPDYWAPLEQRLQLVFSPSPLEIDVVCHLSLTKYGEICRLAAPNPDLPAPNPFFNPGSIGANPDPVAVTLNPVPGPVQPVAVTPAHQHRILRAHATMVVFLRKLLPLLDYTSDRHIRPDPDTIDCPLLRAAYGFDDPKVVHPQHKVRHRDQHNPFREMAPTRSFVKEGFASAGYLRTRSGLFSDACLRGITLGTTLSFKKPYFQDLDDFTRTVQEIESSPSGFNMDLDICTMKAYGGNPAAKRSPKLAPDIWKATETWPSAMAAYGTAKMPWSEAVDWVQSSNMPQSGPGTLTGYLLTADLACSGVVEEPTASEIAEQVLKLGKGALSGLVTLGIALSKKATASKEAIAEACTDGFCDLYVAVKYALGDDSERMGFSPIMLEHALCKFSRFKNLKVCNFTEDELKPIMEILDSEEGRRAVYGQDNSGGMVVA